MKVGDLVTDDRSHMDKSNLFYNAWLRYGVILNIDESEQDVATVMWHRYGKSWVTSTETSKLEVLSET